MTKPEQLPTPGSPGLTRRLRPAKPPTRTAPVRWRRTAIASGLAAALLLPTLVVQQAVADEIDVQAAPIETIPGQPNTIWFDEPLPTTGDAQRQWENRALPIGNGALGAVVYGGINDEKLQLNEKSLWTGGPGSPGGYNYGNWTDNRGPEDMQAVRDLITNSPTKGIPAATVAQKLGQPKLNFGAYQTFGELKLDMAGLGEATNYRRALDIGNSVVTTTFTSNGVNYTREYFATAADDVIVMRITADQPGKVGFTARLDLPNGRTNVSNTAADGRITTAGTLNNGLRFESQVQVIAENGTRNQDSSAGRVTVTNADSALVVFGAATDYALDYGANYRTGVNPHEPVTATVNTAVSTGFDSLRNRHIADYSSLYDRATLDLGAELPNIPTDELLAKYRGTIDPASARALEALFFQYGRYLLISSSRDGSLPANLQGVWNRSNNPPWDSDYHVNINMQMNYWPAETTNLSETTGPFFDYVDSMVAPGTVTASTMYGARGWVTGNETNVYGFTGLHQYPESFWQPDAAAWLSQHYFEHYQFTKDEAFLRERAYPMMKSISQFWFDFLVVDPRDGSLVVSPSYSPEQGEFSAGASISQELVWSLLSQTSQAAEILNESDATFLAELKGTLENLDPGLRVGSWGLT
jgi:alpha-L-fucosidase 2